jgi:hypothetical protein
VVEHPLPGRAPLSITVDGAGQFGGVGTEQVVECVPAGGPLGDQVRTSQLGQ